MSLHLEGNDGDFNRIDDSLKGAVSKTRARQHGNMAGFGLEDFKYNN